MAASRNFKRLVVILSLFTAICNSEKIIRTTTTVQSKETLTIKNKLAKAEGRVGDLISRLDSVQDDATRTKNEIHSTLLEVWKIVDMLGQDRCGEVVDKVRVAQKNAENKVGILQEEVSIHLKEIETLKLEHVQKGEAFSGLQKEISAERSRREALEAEARELRDKLHWASAVSNETQKYEVVAERLAELITIARERMQLLHRILGMVGDAHSGSEGWYKEIESLSTMIRDAERDFSGGYQSAAVEGLRRQIEDLERRLREAQRVRDSATDEGITLRKTIESLQRKVSSTGLGFGKARDRVVVAADEGTSIIGVVTLCVISLCAGAVGVFFLGLWQNEKDKTPTAEPEKYGFTPTSSRTSPGFHSSAQSPLQFVNNDSAVKTPGSRGSTPRRY